MAILQLIGCALMRTVSVLKLFSVSMCYPETDAVGNTAIVYKSVSANLLQRLDGMPLGTALAVVFALTVILSVLSLVMKNNRLVVTAGRIAFVILAILFVFAVVLAIKSTPKY